jgi:hypothetical protein
LRRHLRGEQSNRSLSRVQRPLRINVTIELSKNSQGARE